jgi:hypothetical protein
VCTVETDLYISQMFLHNLDSVLVLLQSCFALMQLTLFLPYIPAAQFSATDESPVENEQTLLMQRESAFCIQTT